ncbi:MAG: hypothetical protein AAF799_35370 [Myxococcota bacterium]
MDTETPTVCGFDMAGDEAPLFAKAGVQACDRTVQRGQIAGR